ncbi:ribosomal protein S18 acetylase RimI-like enzyme [Luteibacter rhizovicinus]|uniref:Ribosomal protein S18 acetylase RimI-like enzyme n=1 Tax=Luteibacter rhizovicinus TaxID=242606 RepID=A0A4R3YNP5_9GAMM|nr:GNAT family N-acetyltransferase [Luteibacter rhizovicinus]TCV93970.1 ribosomal protein S18 acetylase RimI-like enzyme [Luteibacter rhizovicinus]
MSDPAFPIRLAEGDDDDFILEQVPRFVDFTLPTWRRRNECIEGIRKDLVHHLDDQPPNSFLFVAENEDGERVGFIHLQKTQDFFNGRTNCHISDIAVAEEYEGQGVGQALLRHAETWAREHRCQFVTLAVFPGNERARELYKSSGYGEDLMRLAKPVSR